MSQNPWIRNILAIVGCALLIVASGTNRAEAQSVRHHFDPHFPFGSTDVNGSPMIGVVSGQTARFNVVNIGVPANPCQVELTFLDATGGVLAQSEKTLAPGASATLDFTAVAAAAPLRIPIRVVGRLAEERTTGQTSCVVLQSVEVFDSLTLRTSFVLLIDPIW